MRQRPRFIDTAKCTSCGECAKVCPVSLPNEYDEELSLKRAAFKSYAQAIPGAFAIHKYDKAPCRRACPAGINVQGYVQMVKEGKYAEALDYFGLRFKPDSAVPERQKAWLGATTKIEEGRIVIAQVKRGTPAWRAGLNVDDELIAIDDLRVRGDRLDQRLEQYAAGERVSLLVARREQLVQLKLTFGAEPPRLWRLEVDPVATPTQAERLHSWLKGVVENGVGSHFPATNRTGK